jgi:hypothetical protein
MASDDFGRDLASVQALLRKHEGLERDLAALEDKVSLFVLFCFSDQVSLCSSVCLGTHYVEQLASYSEIRLPLPLKYWD